jgi:hypothetical protein
MIDGTGDLKVKTCFTEGAPELYALKWVVDALGGCCVGVRGNFENC